MNTEAKEVIKGLRPMRDQKIMDLVAEAGIDVSGWSLKKDGTPVKNPRANPSYCYEWAFGGVKEPIALCIWHETLEPHEGWVVFKGNSRDRALKLDVLAMDRKQPGEVRSRARDQAKRSRSFDSLVQRAYRQSLPVRVVVLEGERSDEGELGWDSSTVKYRLLDPKSWYVHNYVDDDGSFHLVRDVMAPGADTPLASLDEAPPPPVFVDQFSLSDSPLKREVTSSTYVRSEEVRNSVLQRASGVCECCGNRGFVTGAGEIFLETHHVIPLSEDGPDAVWNVVALCPNDHRRAHHAEDRDAVKGQLLELLNSHYPLAAQVLRDRVA